MATLTADIRQALVAVLAGDADLDTLQSCIDRIDQATAWDMLDALRERPDAGHVIYWSMDEMREHVANAREIEEADVTDEQVREACQAIDWNLDFDYDSLL